MQDAIVTALHYHDALANTFMIDTGSIPYDGVARKEIVTVHPAISSIFVALACAGIAFTIACLIFNFIYRNAK